MVMLLAPVRLCGREAGCRDRVQFHASGDAPWDAGGDLRRATGDISAGGPQLLEAAEEALYRAQVGGGFIEIFDDRATARATRVILCQRPEDDSFRRTARALGNAVQMVHTYAFEAVGPTRPA